MLAVMPRSSKKGCLNEKVFEGKLLHDCKTDRVSNRKWHFGYYHVVCYVEFESQVGFSRFLCFLYRLLSFLGLQYEL